MGEPPSRGWQRQGDDWRLLPFSGLVEQSQLSARKQSQSVGYAGVGMSS